jgi:putative hydrolase
MDMAGFGFTPDDPTDPEGKGEENVNPFGDFKDVFRNFSGMGLNIQSLMAALSGKSTPQSLSKELIRDISRKFLSAHGELPVSVSDLGQAQEAMNIADLWLNEATAFAPVPVPDICAISRRDWIDSTLPGWEELARPLVEGMTEAMRTMISENLGESENGIDIPGFDLGKALGDNSGDNSGGSSGMGSFNIPQPVLLAIMGTFVSSLISTQLGQTIGNLSSTVTGSNDVALPLTNQIRPHLIPQNLDKWAADLGIDKTEVHIYLALREIAAARLFAASPWLKEHIKGAIAAYGKGIRIDISRVTEQAQEALDSGLIDPKNPESMTFALTGGMFTPEETPNQKQAIENLENLLALIEGWIDAIVTQAAGARLPSIERLRETQRRRRATKSPTQQLFATLVGLEVSPRRTRDAIAFWEEILRLSSLTDRDELWSESYLLPTGEQLTDAVGFLKSRTVPDDLSGLN